MATVSVLGSTVNTTAGNKTVVATPALNDLIVVVSVVTGVVTATVTDNNSDGLGGGIWNSTSDQSGFSTSGRLNIWVRNSLIGSATSTTWTASQASSTGGGLVVLAISGMSKAASSGVKLQEAGQSSGTSGTTPAPVFGAAPSSSSVIIAAAANGGTTASLTPRSSPAYTEDFDNGYSTPATGLEVMHINSGETSATITWGSTSASAFASAAVELDTSALAAALAQYIGGGYYP